MTAPVMDATLEQSLGASLQWQDRWWSVHAKCKGKTHLFFAPAGERPEARARRDVPLAADSDAGTVSDR